MNAVTKCARGGASPESHAPKAFRAVALLVSIACTGALATSAQESQAKHAITVKFDYDFTAVHACTPQATTKCVSEFIVYDISGTKPYKLFSIPAPAGASGPVAGISGDSQPLLFEPGKHLLGVTAKVADGGESNPYACTVWATIL